MKSKKLSEVIIKTFKSSGFVLSEPDVLLDSDYIIERSGEKFRSSMLTFDREDGKTMCLRPDLTVASCISFLQKKSSLDKVNYSLLFFEDEALAGEIFVRIKEVECSLDDALKQSSQGPPGLSTGRVGPVALGEMPSALAELMRVSQPGQLWPPKQIEGGWVIVRHEKLWPAVFNRYERLRLLLELGDIWITDQRKKP